MLIHDRVYGQWEADDPLALSLIALPQFQRLYQVGQYGSYWFGLPQADTTRAEHSLGVYYLLRHFGASREEQIAGLLHDISHTVFSHVTDHLYDDALSQSGQDKRHSGIISQSQIANLLSEHGFSHQQIGDLERYSLLDRALPDLCCDRLDYFLRDSVCYQEITAQEARGILSRIVVVNNGLAVDDADAGRFLLKHSILMTKKYWGPAWGCFIFERTAAALRRGLEQGIISPADLFTTDQAVWQKLKQSGDQEINRALEDVEQIKNIKLCLDESGYDYHFLIKFRGVNPLVSTQQGLRRVSEIFPELEEYLRSEKDQFQRGHFVKVARES